MSNDPYEPLDPSDKIAYHTQVIRNERNRLLQVFNIGDQVTFDFTSKLNSYYIANKPWQWFVDRKWVINDIGIDPETNLRTGVTLSTPEEEFKITQIELLKNMVLYSQRLEKRFVW